MISIILILFCAIFFPGLIVRVKSIASGRKGPSILQPWRDILVLIKKGSKFGSTTSIIFQIAATIYLSTILTTILLIPFTNQANIFSFSGDFVLFSYLLALGRFFFILSAMDTGSSFEGMGANREALYSMLLEPTFFIIVGSLALLNSDLSMQALFSSGYFTHQNYYLVMIIIVYLLVQLTMIENSRLPIDDPKTHLELTMVHEVMVLDNSGFDFALIKTGTILKYTIYGSLIANLIIPCELAIYYQILLYILIQALFAIIIGLLESFRARKKMMKNAQFIISHCSIAFVSFLLCLLILNQMLK